MNNVLRALGLDVAPTRCGRYELRDKLGEGSMGVVYRAHDPELDREVAIKLLRRDAGEDARQRLRREAHALARLSDPRVVAVLAIGEAAGQCFIAMELVSGQTLAAWAEGGERDVRARRERALRFLREAGMGLAAAHRMGVVHRDFKPANVLIRDDGLVKVADFGLARMGERLPTHEETRSGQDSRATVSVTAIAGTPLYMAPEQHEGRPADARSDQFAFAASAWEILTGVPPFAGRTLVELGEAKLAGVLQGGHDLPRHVRRALRRAMKTDPDQRFADMDALLDALAPRRLPVAWGLGATAAVVGMATALLWTDGRPMHPCAQLQPPRWSSAEREALERSFSRGQTLQAPDAWSRLQVALDTHVEQWARTRDAECKGASASRAPAVAACLERAARGFDRMVELASSDSATALQVVSMLDELPKPQCGSHEPSAAWREVEDALVEAGLLGAASRHAEELAALEELESRARALGDPQLLGRVLVSLGTAKFRFRQLQAAVQLLEEAHALAIEARDDVLASEGTVVAVEILFELGDARAIRRWLDHGNVAHERLGRPASREAVWLLVFESQLAAWFENDDERSLELAIAAAEMAETLGQRDDRAFRAWTSAHEMLFDRYMKLVDIDEAERLARQIGAAQNERLGADHPISKMARTHLGDVLVARRRNTDALAAYEAALDGARAYYGHGTLEVAEILVKTVTAQRLLGDLDSAFASAREALRIFEDIGGAPALVQTALAPLAIVQQVAGDLEGARATGERLVALIEGDLGPSHGSLAPATFNLAEVLLELGEHAEAERRYRRSLEIVQGNFGPDLPHLAYPLVGLGEVALLDGRLAQAETHLRRAAELAAAHPDPKLLPRIESALARLEQAH